MNKRLIKSKKKVKLLWALTAIPVMVAGTIAASCAPVTNSSQGQSGDVDINWTNLVANELGKEVYPSQVSISGDVNKLVDLVQWNNSIDKTKIQVKTIEYNNASGSLKAEIIYGNMRKVIQVTGFKKSADTEVEDNSLEGNKKKFEVLKQEFASKLYVNEASGSINGKFVTKANIATYIDAFKGINPQTNILEFKQATIEVLKVHSDASTDNKVIIVDVLFTAYGNSDKISYSIGGFLNEKEHWEKEIIRYTEKWNYQISAENLQKLNNMHSTQLHNEQLFRKYITVDVAPEYAVSFESISWPSINSVEAVLWFSLKNWDAIAPVKKVIRYDGFKTSLTSLHGAPFIYTEYGYNDPIVYTKNLDWNNWNAKVVNWDSERSKNYMASALLEAGNKVYRTHSMDYFVRQAMTRAYGLSTDSWKISVELPENWYERVKQLTNWDKEFYDEGRSGFGGASDWAHPQARLKRGGWIPELKLVVTTDKVANFKLEQSFWLVGTDR